MYDVEKFLYYGKTVYTLYMTYSVHEIMQSGMCGAANEKVKSKPAIQRKN